MKKTDLIALTVFTASVISIIIWVRSNLPFFAPLLEVTMIPFRIILGVSVIAILRNIIGIRTIGIFGPAIIALGITLGESGLIWGLALYIDIFIFAMLLTFTLYPLAMEDSHRVAIVISITAIATAVLDMLGEIFRMEVLETPLFFPVLITSWLADRFVIQVNETDWVESAKQLLGTFVVIIIAYFSMSSEELIRFTALNPEVWAIIILMNVMLALKVKFRLSEYLRFNPVLKSGKPRTDILSMNRRNQEYIFKHNPQNLFPSIAKDKMKVTFHQLGIPTPETYAIIQDKRDIGFAEKIMTAREDFVIKPAHGFGGKGILVVERKGNIYMAEQEYSIENLKNHISLIVDGQYSTEWRDVAVIEEKVETHPVLKNFYWGGVPDIRIIVFEGFPVMAMTRLPTRESGGKANMHKGAIGMGLSIAEGKSLQPYWRGHGGEIERHPDTNALLKEMEIHDWERYLEIACLAQAASRLGYSGVDIVPTTKGPMVLEVNKRPGLEIQNTNLEGLLKRLEFVEKRLPEHRFKPMEERVKLCQEWDRKGWE